MVPRLGSIALVVMILLLTCIAAGSSLLERSYRSLGFNPSQLSVSEKRSVASLFRGEGFRPEKGAKTYFRVSILKALIDKLPITVEESVPSLTIYNASFRSPIILTGIVAKANIRFVNCTFNSFIKLDNCNFRELEFDYCDFASEVNLNKTVIQENLYFRECTFRRLFIQNSTINGNLYASGECLAEGYDSMMVGESIVRGSCDIVQAGRGGLERVVAFKILIRSSKIEGSSALLSEGKGASVAILDSVFDRDVKVLTQGIDTKCEVTNSKGSRLTIMQFESKKSQEKGRITMSQVELSSQLSLRAPHTNVIDMFNCDVGRSSFFYNIAPETFKLRSCDLGRAWFSLFDSIRLRNLETSLLNFFSLEVNNAHSPSGEPLSEVPHDLMVFRARWMSLLYFDGFVVYAPIWSARHMLNIAGFDGMLYAKYEAYLSSCGQKRESDQVFIDGRRRELASKNTSKLDLIFGWFSDRFAGFGRSPERSLIPIAVLVALGAMLPFQRRHMRLADAMANAPYSSLWFSLDAFFPVIDLGISQKYEPSTRYGWIYYRLHILLGWLFVPFAIAALTGLLK